MKTVSFSISALYFLVLLPHLMSDGLNFDKLRSPWYVLGLAVSLIWVVIAAMSVLRLPKDPGKDLIISSLLLAFQALFFAGLFVAA